MLATFHIDIKDIGWANATPAKRKALDTWCHPIHCSHNIQLITVGSGEAIA